LDSEEGIRSLGELKFRTYIQKKWKL